MPVAFDPDAVIDALAPMLGIEVADTFRPGVRQNLEATAKIAQAVLEFELPDEAEAAPVFTA
jgi:hypothetical protein